MLKRIHSNQGENRMNKILVGLIFVVLLASCNSKLSYIEISQENVQKDVQDFIMSVSDTNGVYLYLEGTEKAYVFLNGVNKKQGELFFKQFHVEPVGNMLDISYTEEDLNVTDKTVKNQMLYQINLDKEYNTFQLFENGEEISFDVISGN